MQAFQHGFTLLEMMIVTGILAILAGIAVPSFNGPVYKARRADGIATLMQLQMSQEQWRSNNPRYASLEDLQVPATSGMRHYTLAIAEVTASGYSLIATATGVQAGDRGCRVLRIIVTHGQAAHASGPDDDSANSDADNRRCWGI